jgi:hypothetical protein
MIPNNPEAEIVAWLLFSLVLIWALWQGLWELERWVKNNPFGREDIHDFPDELRGEPGPGTFVASQGEMNPRDGEAGTRSQAR